MLQDIFGSSSMHKEAKIMGSQLDHDPLDIQTNATDLQYLMSNKARFQRFQGLSQHLDELENQTLQNKRVTLSEMVRNLNKSQLAMASLSRNKSTNSMITRK